MKSTGDPLVELLYPQAVPVPGNMIKASCGTKTVNIGMQSRGIIDSVEQLKLDEAIPSRHHFLKMYDYLLYFDFLFLFQ